MIATAEAVRPRLFYGWRLVASLAVIMFLSAGFGFYAIGVFITPLEDSFGWSRGQVSLAMALATLASGLVGPGVGMLVERLGVRLIMAGGALLMGFALASLSLTWSLFYLYPMFILMGIGQAGVMLIPITAVLSNWFERKRGLAIGLTTTGIGLGGLVMAPLAAVLISVAGWRVTFLIMGIVVACVALPIIAFVVRQRPQDHGLLPDGDSPRLSEAGAQDQRGETAGWTVRDAMTTGTFVALTAAFSLAMVTTAAVLLHIVPFLEDRGIAREQAGLMLGFVSGAGVLGKVTAGYLTDRMPPRLIAATVFLMLAVGIVILVETDSVLTMAAFTLIFGFSMGSVVALQPMMIVYCFGTLSVATILGASNAIVWSVDAFGPMTAGLVYDVAETYRPIFLAFAGMDCIAAVLIFLFGHPPPVSAPPVIED